MCFSTMASFSSSAILVTGGLFCLKKATQFNKPYWAFSILPLMFGIQQATEGVVWWALGANDAENLRLSALGFLFFSHFIWLVWIPFSCYLTEPSHKRKMLFLLMSGTGVFFGASIFTPFLLYSDWLIVSAVNHSISYQTTLIYDEYLPRIVVTTGYMLIVLVPLMLSSDRHHRILGILVFLSAILAMAFFNFAFISVWCYFAAVISLYICYITTMNLDTLSARQQLASDA